MAKEAGMKALADAGVSYKDIEQVVAGYCYGDTTCGQRAVYQLGLTGVPVYNVSFYFEISVLNCLNLLLKYCVQLE